MDYNNVINKLSQNLGAAKAKKDKQKKQISMSTPKTETTSTILNKIGLEVQRQGG